jgi:hypothetical protein
MAIDIEDVDRRMQYTGSGTGPYDFTFNVLAQTDIAVYQDDDLLTLTTDYSVTVNPDGTGSVTTVASMTGSTLTIIGARPYERTTDYAEGGDFPAETINDELDSILILIQQLREEINRSLRLSSTGIFSGDLVLPSPESGKLLGWNLAGDGFQNYTAADVDLAIVSAFIATLLDDADADEARTTLGAAGSGAVTGSGLTMSTARLLGRTTGSTGVVEEISVGSGLSLAAGTLTATATAASQAEQEAGTEAAKYVAPLTQQFHPSAVKAEINFNGTGTAAARNSYNCTLTDNSTGDYTIVIGTDFSSANWTPMITHPLISTSANQAVNFVSQAAGSIRFVTIENGVATDKTYVWFMAAGDQ